MTSQTSESDVTAILGASGGNSRRVTRSKNANAIAGGEFQLVVTTTATTRVHSKSKQKQPTQNKATKLRVSAI